MPVTKFVYNQEPFQYMSITNNTELLRLKKILINSLKYNNTNNSPFILNMAVHLQITNLLT